MRLRYNYFKPILLELRTHSGAKHCSRARNHGARAATTTTTTTTTMTTTTTSSTTGTTFPAASRLLEYSNCFERTQERASRLRPAWLVAPRPKADPASRDASKCSLSLIRVERHKYEKGQKRRSVVIGDGWLVLNCGTRRKSRQCSDGSRALCKNGWSQAMGVCW